MHHIVILLLCLVILVASWLLKADENGVHLFGFKWPMYCLLYKTVGIKCALCGLTRSFSSMAHGDFRRAFEFHRLGPALFAFVALQIPYRIYALTIHPNRVNKKMMRVHMAVAAAVLAAALVNWLVYLGGLIP
ncbi:MAG: DUF2752 domain-containing protein [Phycisphaerales bacterium]|nr:MAG: DUF2752 domain-containing protein [Phycisphaerales bacterium]